MEKDKIYCDEDSIPCLYLQRKCKLSDPTHVLLYCHGNAEDLGKVYPILDYLRTKLPVNIIAPEYPGYGIAKGFPNENSVIETVLSVYEFVISPLGLCVSTQRVIVYGFSIGSAAALGAMSKITSTQVQDVANGITYGKRRHEYEYEYESDDDDDDDNGEKNEKNDKNDNDKKDESDCKEEEGDDINNNNNNNNKIKPLTKTTSNFAPNGNTLMDSISCFPDNVLDSIDKNKKQGLLLEMERKRSSVSSNSSSNSNPNSNDPFSKLPLRQLLSMLNKADVEIPKNSNKEDLLELARAHDLIPSLKCCVDSNCTPKYSLLVLVCPFSSISKVVSDKIGTWASYLLSDRFDNLERIGQIHGPLLIIHGSNDSIIPCDHSRVLHSQAIRHCHRLADPG
ncbi:hypothetical protein RFI_32568 [Reticulomyxa filosa]|uniref:Uncharacterized protein n=1 Tax=Reticulomyxa filosa TaxID=46433 RepID=X6LSG2_RETFI|nr:hypothetical protein RFI_32568 [Reticulomyxa filosa]|eukprot:ETO04828.1 hypothetical protein RFI_32568 [Reticulomyxa filosa]